MRVEQLLKQLKREFLKVKVLQSLLDSLLFFLASNLVLFLFSVQVFSGVENIYVLAALSFVFLGADLYYRFQKYSLEIYEEKNPELREILRTARDNLDQQNIVSQALFDELLERARKVTSESIIPAKHIIYKTLAVGILSFLTVMSGLADFQFRQQGVDLLENPENIRDLVGEGEEDDFQVKNATGISGDESEIDSSKLDIDFAVNGSGTAQGGGFDPTEAPPESELTLDATGGSSAEDLELAKRYSIAVKDIG